TYALKLISPNVTDSWGNTILHVLAWHGYYSNHHEWHSNRKRKSSKSGGQVKDLMAKIYNQLAPERDDKKEQVQPRISANNLSGEAREILKNEFVDKIFNRLVSAADAIFGKPRTPEEAFTPKSREKFTNKSRSKVPPVKILFGKIYDQLASGGDPIFDKPRMPDYGLSEEERKNLKKSLAERDKNLDDPPQVKQQVKTQVEQHAEPQVEHNTETQVEQQTEPQAERHVLESQVEQQSEPPVERRSGLSSCPSRRISSSTERGTSNQVTKELNLLSNAISLVLQQLEHRVETVVDYLYHSRNIQAAKESKQKGKLSKEDKLVRELRSADDTLANDAKLTPLIFAAANGKAGMVQALLDYKMEIMWDYGSIKKTRLDLGELDTFHQKATMNHEKGALEIDCRNNDSEIIRLPVFQRLLECKWTLYGERIALWRFFNQLTYLLVFTMALALLPNDASYDGTETRNRSRLDYGNSCGRLFITQNFIDENNNYVFDQDIKIFFRFVLEITLVIWSGFNFVIECHEIKAAGIKKYVTGFGWFENMLQWVDFALFSMGVGFRFAYWNYADTVTGRCMLSWRDFLYC
ncbi:hypothetical protein HDU76_008419, partial [Blyttiomyces sp. JEL0837]